MNHPNQEVETVERSREEISFSLKDDRGRAIGQVLVKTTQQKNVPVQPTPAERLDNTYFLPDGLRYGYSLQGTRDGRSFGPSHTVWFRTAKERDEAAIAALARSRQRYLASYRDYND